MENIKNIKQFLKPNWAKIFILMIILSSLILLVISLKLKGQSQISLIPTGGIFGSLIAFLIGSPFFFLYALVTDANLEIPKFMWILFFSFGIIFWYFIASLVIYFFGRFNFLNKETNKELIKKMTLAKILIIVIAIGAIELIRIFELKKCINQKILECQRLCVYDSTYKSTGKYRLEGIEEYSDWIISEKEFCIDLCLNYYFQQKQFSKFPTTSKILYQVLDISSWDLVSSSIFSNQKKVKMQE